MKVKGPLFITFEGGEGAGKTTLMQNLHLALEKSGYQVLSTREPGGTALGESIRNTLLQRKHLHIGNKAELFLFLSARSQHVEEVIIPALNKDKIVLCDRFSDSSIAYQGYARGLGISEVTKLCQFATNNLNPDLTFYLDIDPKIGILRASQVGELDSIEQEEIVFHRKVRDGFLKLASTNPKIKILDATKSRDELLQQALIYLEKCDK